VLEELKKIVEVKRELELKLDSLVPLSEDRMEEIDRLQMVCVQPCFNLIYFGVVSTWYAAHLQHKAQLPAVYRARLHYATLHYTVLRYTAPYYTMFPSDSNSCLSLS
jgi:hypothetical protein